MTEWLVSAARKATLAHRIVPVFAGAAFKNKGVQPLLDAVTFYLPSPVDLPDVEGKLPDDESVVVRRAPDEGAPFCALAFKVQGDAFLGTLTYLRVYSGSIGPGDVVLNPRTGKRERLGRLLHMHANRREDVERASAGQIVAAAGLRNVATGDTLCDQKHPIVLERMTFAEPVIWLSIEPATKLDEDKLPADRGTGTVVLDEAPAGAIPCEFMKSALYGAKEALEIGALAGFPMVDVVCAIVGGSFHEVDSSDIAFRIAASMAVQDAAGKAIPILLEPIMKLEISAPGEYTGAVIGDLSGRRGSVNRMDSRPGVQVIGAVTPLSSMFGYATDLRSATQGRASFSMHFHQYAEVPPTLSKEIVARFRGY